MSDLAAGYYRYLAQAVAALAQNTPEARAVLYQQVRGAVAHRLDTAQPPHSDADIARHKRRSRESIRLFELSVGYYPSLAKAAAALAPNTPEARAALYQRGRTSLERRLRAAQPPRSEADIAIHQAALEEAVHRVEAEYGVGDSAMGTDHRREPSVPVTPGDDPRRSGEGGFRLPVGLLLIALIGCGIAMGVLKDAQGDLAVFEVAARYGLIGLGAALLAYAAYVVVRRRRRLRDAGIQRRRVAALAVSPGGSETRRRDRLRLYQEAVQKLNDSDLLWAYWLPEHAEEAKKSVLSELERRGYSGDQVRRWSPPASQLTVPPSGERPVSVSKYSRLVLMRRGGWILFQVLSLAGLVLLAGAMFNEHIDPALGVSGVAAMIGPCFFWSPLGWPSWSRTARGASCCCGPSARKK